MSWARVHATDTVLLVGIPERIMEAAGGSIPPNVEIVPAGQVVEMDESPALALKAKKDSSIMVAMDLIKAGRGDALVTAGHSGAGMAAAVLKLGRLPGVDRPALAVQMVTETGPFVLLDIGANMDSSGNNLYQFAHMGSLYAERVLGVDNPRIALLSIGEEKGKGDQAVQQATQMLDDDGRLNFIGNVEGRDLFKGTCDVIVTDGFTGNVLLKTAEGAASFLGGSVRNEIKGDPLAMFGSLFMMPALGRLKRKLDWEEYGAVPLLGVNGGCFIGHGASGPRAFRSAIHTMATFVENRVNEHIREEIQSDHVTAA
jgi:glycerol-3-phosphate acyltransferase PlsX